MRFKLLLLAAVLGSLLACLAIVFVYNLPPVHQRLAWRVSGWQAQVRRALNPPEQLVFVPGGQAEPGAVSTLVEATAQALQTAAALDPQPRKRGDSDLHPSAIHDGAALCHANPAADPHSGQSRAERDRARVPAVQQLRSGQPGDGAVVLGLAG